MDEVGRGSDDGAKGWVGAGAGSLNERGSMVAWILRCPTQARVDAVRETEGWTAR
jgi:hypothetical protein